MLEVTPSLLHTNQQFGLLAGLLALIWHSKMRAGSSFSIVSFLFLLTCFGLCKVLNRTQMSLLLTVVQVFAIVYVLAELNVS